jgi:hypothetical protein
MQCQLLCLLHLCLCRSCVSGSTRWQSWSVLQLWRLICSVPKVCGHPSTAQGILPCQTQHAWPSSSIDGSWSMSFEVLLPLHFRAQNVHTLTADRLHVRPWMPQVNLKSALLRTRQPAPARVMPTCHQRPAPATVMTSSQMMTRPEGSSSGAGELTSHLQPGPCRKLILRPGL